MLKAGSFRKDDQVRAKVKIKYDWGRLVAARAGEVGVLTSGEVFPGLFPESRSYVRVRFQRSGVELGVGLDEVELISS